MVEKRLCFFVVFAPYTDEYFDVTEALLLSFLVPSLCFQPRSENPINPNHLWTATNKWRGCCNVISFGNTANLTEQIYYVPLHVYVRKPSFTTSTRLFSSTFPAQFSFRQLSQLPSLILCGQDTRTRGDVQSALIHNQPHPMTSPPCSGVLPA